MRLIIMFYCIASLLYAHSVFAVSDDFLDDLRQTIADFGKIKIPSDKIYLHTEFNNLKKTYLIKAQALADGITLLKNIKRLPLDNGIEIERELALVEKQSKDILALDTPKNKILDSAGKARNEALHERLAYLRKQEDILRNAQIMGIDNAIQLAEHEGSDILSAFDRQLASKIVPASTRTYIDPSQDLRPTNQTTDKMSDKMRRNLAEQAKKRKFNAFPVDQNDGFGGYLPTDETLKNRYLQHRLKLPAPTPVPSSSQSGLAGKMLKFGGRALRILPLVGELWTRKENALLASAHALTEACIHKDSDVIDTTSYVATQYAYRGFGFLSFVPNLADSATPENIQTTLNFLVRSGCFEEYRMFVDKNRDAFADLGLLGDLSILSDAKLVAEEKSYRDLEMRLNPSRVVL